MRFLLESLGVFFLFLIVLVLLLVLAIAVIVFLMVTSLSTLATIDQQAKDYIEQSIRAIANHWAVSDLVARAAPRMLEGGSAGQFHSIFDACRQTLGALVDYKGSKGSLQGLPIAGNLRFLMRLTGKKAELEASKDLLLGEYQAQAEFAQGLANFEIQCLRQHGEWSILDLQITTTHQDTLGDTKTTTFSLGEKTTMQALVEENKKRLELEKLLK